MGTNKESTQKYTVERPSRYARVIFKPSVQFEEDRLSVDSECSPGSHRESEESVDLRHTTHSLKRQLRLRRCKMALIGLVVALLLSIVVTVVVVLVLRRETARPSSGNNSTVATEYEDCKSNQFTCAQGKCIPARWRCDGEDDCLNKEDEQECDEDQTPATPQSCQAWKEEFQINCPPDGCPFYPICTPTGHWSPVQCTTDNVSCWCVDWDTGATVPGSFVKDIEKEDQPFCEQKPA